jgi:predicted CxxxxCH...CXXCH cytochrome family protein
MIVMNRFEYNERDNGMGGTMKRTWISHLFLTLTLGVATAGIADAATMGTITTCAGCHITNPQTNQAPVEGSTRNSPAGAILGSHAKHLTSTSANTCAACHVVPTTTNHRDGKIQMAASMAGGVTYSAATGGVVTQDNQLTTTGLGTCSGTTCHTSGSPVWGTVATCNSCHGDWSQANFKHAKVGLDLDETHREFDCVECHVGRQYDASPMCGVCHDDGRNAFDTPPGTRVDSRTRNR